MRKDEFAIVDNVRKEDMDYLLDRFVELLKSPAITEEIALGISLCAGITKEYRENIGVNNGKTM